MGTAAITTTGLTKRFGNRAAVDGLDLSVPTGSISGFVGPNGAGKTTTIRMLLGLIAPTAGSGTILGGSLAEPSSYLSKVGALIESPAFYPQLSGRENLKVLATLGGLPSNRIDPALERVGLVERGGDRYARYSLGMKQRLGIAAALLPQPELLLLDEPTNGLDPAGIVEMRTLVASLAAEGITIFISSHLLSEIEQICNHLIMLRTGAVVFQGSVAELQGQLTRHLVISSPTPEGQVKLVEVASSLGLTAIHNATDDVVEVTGTPEDLPRLNAAAVAAGIDVHQLGMSHQSLEDAYFTLTGTHSGDVAGSRLGGLQS